MKGAIVVDDWKLPVFRRRLTDAGHAYEDGGGLTAGITVLTVHTDDLDAMKALLTACEAECALQGRPKQ